MASPASSTFSDPYPREQKLLRPDAAQKSREIGLSAPSANSADKMQALAASAATTDVASDEILRLLRGSVGDASKAPDAVMRATAEAARVLTGADGVAVAFRTKGTIVCRAKSGELAPDLGSCVNGNSGISGECLRAAAILVCQDARTDSRVDNEVCERMGIRSIVVVPLRGPVGIAGILEVFSARANAFEDREINSLRGLAEVAEAAYERERRAQQEATRAALRSAHRLPALLTRAVGSENGNENRARELCGLENEPTNPRLERILWVVGVATVALLLITGVWLSWHGPISELTELEAAEAHHTTTQPTPPQPKTVSPPPKPAAGVLRAEGQKSPRPSTKISLADGETSTDTRPAQSAGSVNQPVTAKILSDAASSALPDQPPTVMISSASNHGEFGELFTGSRPLPAMAAPVSRGVTEGALLRRVNPVYPPQAKTERIAGPVVLEIRVAKDGTVSSIRTVSGNPQLTSAAVDAVRKWQYSPTLLNGQPIETSKQITVLFKLP